MLHVLLVSRLTRWGLTWKLTTRVLVYAALLVSRLTCLYRNCALTKDCIIRLIKDMYVFIGKMPLRRKTTRLNAEDLLIILQQYNLFPIVASLNYKIYQCFYGRTKQHCCNVNPGPFILANCHVDVHSNKWKKFRYWSKRTLQSILQTNTSKKGYTEVIWLRFNYF
jgi:hypothetical protein